MPEYRVGPSDSLGRVVVLGVSACKSLVSPYFSMDGRRWCSHLVLDVKYMFCIHNPILR